MDKPIVCAICSDPCDGYHFSVPACRACAAFFRRAVSLHLIFEEHCDGKCDVRSRYGRKICRSCRYRRCLEAGMDKGAVQARRDLLGSKQEQQQTSQHDSNFQSSSQMIQPKYSESLTQLLRMKANYEILQQKRTRLLPGPLPKEIFYDELQVYLIEDAFLVHEWMKANFDAYNDLPNQQQRNIFKTFWYFYALLELTYTTASKGSTYLLFIPTGHYIDSARYYTDRQGCHVEDCKNLARLFEPFWAQFRAKIVVPAVREKIDLFEFFTLATLALWDHGAEYDSEEVGLIARNIRENAIKEIVSYYSQKPEIGDPSMRLATVLSILPVLQKMASRKQEEMEMINALNIYPVKDSFYKLLTGKM